MLLLLLILLLVTFPVVVLVTRTRPAEQLIQERIKTLVKLQPKTVAPWLTVEQSADHSLGMRLTELFQSLRIARKVETKLLHSGSKISLGKFLLASATAGVGAAVIVFLLTSEPPLTMIALAAGMLVPYALLNWKCARRLKKFNEALPDAIELMARALRAGHSVSSSIEVVAQQSPEPLKSEFATCAQQQRVGIPFRDAVVRLAERVPSSDLHFVVTAILVQKETGGDLTEILDRTTEVIRERIRIQGEIRTYTAQGRLTGWILSGLPVALLGMISISSPSYTHVLFYDPLGKKLLYAGAGLIVLGGLLIRKIVDIKV
jgi:tight adherence protein B